MAAPSSGKLIAGGIVIAGIALIFIGYKKFK